MHDFLEVIGKIRDTPEIETQVSLFKDFLEHEFGYCGFTYGMSSNSSSISSLLSNFVLLEQGMDPEWMDIYVNEALHEQDISIRHLKDRQGLLLQSHIFESAEAEKLPEDYRYVAKRVVDFTKSGFFLSFANGEVKSGMGLHSKDPTIKHDKTFSNETNRDRLLEACRIFHETANWRSHLMAHIGLSKKNLKIIGMLAQGLSHKEINREMGLTGANSVYGHLKTVSAKLGTTTPKETVQRVIDLGLVENIQRSKTIGPRETKDGMDLRSMWLNLL